jgi:hypothetical protein
MDWHGNMGSLGCNGANGYCPRGGHRNEERVALFSYLAAPPSGSPLAKWLAGRLLSTACPGSTPHASSGRSSPFGTAKLCFAVMCIASASFTTSPLPRELVPQKAQLVRVASRYQGDHARSGYSFVCESVCCVVCGVCVCLTPLSLARLVPDGVWRVAMGQSVCAMHLFKGGEGSGRSKCNYLLRPLIPSKLVQC